MKHLINMHPKYHADIQKGLDKIEEGIAKRMTWLDPGDLAFKSHVDGIALLCKQRDVIRKSLCTFSSVKVER